MSQEDVADSFNQQGHRPRLSPTFWDVKEYMYFCSKEQLLKSHFASREHQLV